MSLLLEQNRRKREAQVLIIGLIFANLAVWVQGCSTDERFQTLRKRLGHKPEKGLAIQHVRVFDSETATVRDGQTVVVVGEHIEAVEADKTVKIPTDSEVIDGNGKTVLPGLFDMHAHLQPSAGLPYIASGVTTVRDLGNMMDRLLAMKHAWDSDGEIGPRILMAGAINGRRGKGELVTTEEEAKTVVDRYKGAGYIQTKILSDIKPELVPYIVRVSHAQGMRVSGHVPEGMKAQQFVHDGVDEIQHMNYVFRNFSPSGDRMAAEEAEEGARLDVNSQPVTDFINLLKQKGIVLDPTMNVFENKYGRRGGASQKYYEAMTHMLKRLFDTGVPLVIGTDAPKLPGLSLHHEMEIWVSAGIPAPKVLQIATIGAARVMKVDRETGSVRAGKKADFVLVDGDPTQNISDVHKCRVVLKNGVVYHSADVYQAASTNPIN